MMASGFSIEFQAISFWRWRDSTTGKYKVGLYTLVSGTTTGGLSLHPMRRVGTGLCACPYDCGQVQFKLILSALEMVMGASVMKKTTMADRNQI